MLCDKKYGGGIGGQKRKCKRSAGHSGRCTDMPFLLHLKHVHPKVAAKIERDSFQTSGASWGKDTTGKQAKKNRQPRWTVAPGSSLYPSHYQTYENCIEVARSLTRHAYALQNAPDCPAVIKHLLHSTPSRQSLCPICLLPLDFNDFSKAKKSMALIDTDHIDPTLEHRHQHDNVAFVHHGCNITKGNRSLTDFVNLMNGLVFRHRFT